MKLLKPLMLLIFTLSLTLTGHCQGADSNSNLTINDENSLHFVLKSQDLATFMSFIQPLGIYDFHYNKIENDQIKVTIRPKFQSQKVEPLRSQVQFLQFRLPENKLGKFMAFIKPLGIYQVQLTPDVKNLTRVTISPKGTDIRQVKRVYAHRKPLPVGVRTKSAVAKPTLTVLKFRNKHLYTLEKNFAKWGISVYEKRPLKHGRYEWVLRLSNPNFKKTMRKFIRSMGYKFFRKENLFIIR